MVSAQSQTRYMKKLIQRLESVNAQLREDQAITSAQRDGAMDAYGCLHSAAQDVAAQAERIEIQEDVCVYVVPVETLDKLMWVLEGKA